jgi:hypothetical protein
MNTRHVAALALVGWYLMVAPSLPDKDNQGQSVGPNLSAPLSEWSINTSFDSAKDCEQARTALRNKAVNTKHWLWAQAVSCVASDDPRLGR